jgi:Ricin-type beta-trefoil lectin domain
MRIKTRIYALLTAVLAVVLAFSFLGKPAFARATGYIVNSYLTSSGAGELCLDAAFDDNGHSPANNGDPVQLWTCTDSYNQTWNTPDPGVWGTITSVSGLCLDAVASGATSNGDSVQMWACNGGLQQQWKVMLRMATVSTWMRRPTRPTTQHRTATRCNFIRSMAHHSKSGFSPPLRRVAR